MFKFKKVQILKIFKIVRKKNKGKNKKETKNQNKKQ
jgi:hypothetical protein